MKKKPELHFILRFAERHKKILSLTLYDNFLLSLARFLFIVHFSSSFSLSLPSPSFTKIFFFFALIALIIIARKISVKLN